MDISLLVLGICALRSGSLLYILKTVRFYKTCSLDWITKKTKKIYHKTFLKVFQKKKTSCMHPHEGHKYRNNKLNCITEFKVYLLKCPCTLVYISENYWVPLKQNFTQKSTTNSLPYFFIFILFLQYHVLHYHLLFITPIPKIQFL